MRFSYGFADPWTREMPRQPAAPARFVRNIRKIDPDQVVQGQDNPPGADAQGKKMKETMVYVGLERVHNPGPPEEISTG